MNRETEMKQRIDAVAPSMRQAGAVPPRGSRAAARRYPIGLRAPLVGVAIALLATGCSFAPVHERPVAPVAPQWRDADAAAPARGASGAVSQPQAAEVGWREFYAEPELQELIALALEHNRDLRIAVLNMEAARAQYGIQRADRLPGIGAGAGAARQRVPADLSPSGRSVINEQYDATVGVSAFELDFFGRVRNLSEAALSEYLATAQARRAAQIALVAQGVGGLRRWLHRSRCCCLTARSRRARSPCG